ncbi:MAG: hypothetical protein ACK5NK_05350 [Niabella sp.]
MKVIQPIHNFHIPVMGLAFTIDSPIRVAHFGINSVISIADDELIEKMTAFYAEKFQKPYQEISKKVEDFRATRITNYLNLVDQIVKEKFQAFKNDLLEKKSELDNFLKMLPTQSELKLKLEEFVKKGKNNINELKLVIDQYLHPGSIDVNIMTKVDKDNFENGKQLPVAYNDAHASLRGFANSTVRSSIVFSAGMNPRLYSYIENFEDFYPDESGNIKKKIILKVSDYRSAVIQGNFLAKKGLWVSEYRIESGLNCGGHAFATDGLLMGPILEEFKTKKGELVAAASDLLNNALATKNKAVPKEPLPLKITVQGGVGTAEEHQLLLNYYQVDSVGWGSPFLLVPEATSVDEHTRKLLANAQEDDLYLSHISPLGVPFNTVKGTTNSFFKNKRISEGKAGSSCPKKLLALSKEYGEEEGICTASKKYQDIKLKELEDKNLSPEAYQKEFETITEKSCLCVGLANASYLELGVPIKGQQQGVVVCPGPNIAYFSKEVSLLQMVQHIYGSQPLKMDENRPNLFIKELELYVSYFKNELNNIRDITAREIKKWEKFKNNLLEGIDYYIDLFQQHQWFKNSYHKNRNRLTELAEEINGIEIGVMSQSYVTY